VRLPDFLTRDDAGFIHLAGRRVGLDQLIFYYHKGYSAEMLADERDWGQRSTFGR
jgi:hypothetical protein